MNKKEPNPEIFLKMVLLFLALIITFFLGVKSGEINALNETYVSEYCNYYCSAIKQSYYISKCGMCLCLDKNNSITFTKGVNIVGVKNGNV